MQVQACLLERKQEEWLVTVSGAASRLRKERGEEDCWKGVSSTLRIFLGGRRLLQSWVKLLALDAVLASIQGWLFRI